MCSEALRIGPTPSRHSVINSVLIPQSCGEIKEPEVSYGEMTCSQVPQREADGPQGPGLTPTPVLGAPPHFQMWSFIAANSPPRV